VSCIAVPVVTAAMDTVPVATTDADVDAATIGWIEGCPMAAIEVIIRVCVAGPPATPVTVVHT